MSWLSALFKREGERDSGSRPERKPPAGAAAQPAGSLDEQVIAVIRRECPTFSADDMGTPFERLGIDSVGMLMIHTRVDELVRGFDDRQWEGIITPADLVAALRKATSAGAQRAGAGANERRRYDLNMPQMALGGLSESWLFKEFGDMHWSVLAKGLGAPSHLLRDDRGERIYATFTRFQLTSTCPLAGYRENELLELDAGMTRYGAGLYFSEVAARGDAKSAAARLMSTFSKFGETASNISLLKGLPDIPADCEIPPLAEFPAFGTEYRARRALALPPAIFECEYELIPSYDINGVGLLYFAAYPIINDICAARHGGRALMMGFSTLHRDVFYFGNSNADDNLIFRLHEWRCDERSLDMLASISRKSDGAVIAHVLTRKVRVDAGVVGWAKAATTSQ